MSFLEGGSRFAHSLAALVSRVLHPFVISVVVLLGIQLSAGHPLIASVGWTLLTFGVVIAPTLLLVLWRIRRGRYADTDVSVREDRHLLYVVGVVCFIVVITLLAALQAPAIVQRTLHAALLAVAVGAVFNRYVNKLSLHSLAMAGSAAVVFFVAPVAALGLVALALLVGWSRAYLARHTYREVLWGWLVGAGSVALWFSLAPV